MTQYQVKYLAFLFILNACSGKETAVSLDLSNPKLLPAAPVTDSSVYQPAVGVLFAASGPALNDVKQSELGDCYLMSTLASLAQNDPNAIRQLIQPIDANHYIVTLYSGSETATLTIDDELPYWVMSGNAVSDAPFFGAETDASGNLILWPALVEKAYIQYNSLHHFSGSGVNSYDGVTGGEPDVVYGVLTGGAANDNSITNDNLKHAGKGGVAGVAMACTDTATDGLVSNHCYTVTGYNTVTQTVSLRNPWGETGASGDVDNFTLTLAEFSANYTSIIQGDIK